MGSDTPDRDRGAGDLVPGAVLRARYVLEEVIGRGGHSLVFRARDLHRATAGDPDGGRIALKALLPMQRCNARAVERLAREFRQMQRLVHPGIARVFDLDCDGDIWFLTMELMAGQTAAQWLRTGPSIGDAMGVIGGCADALHYAHSAGVIHGDLKPSNVLVAADRQIKLIDFGSVPSPDERMEYVVVTPSYASPQVLSGMRAEVRDDVFSLACLSYEVLSEGERPFGDQSSLEAHRARLCPATIEGMPVEVFAALVRSLAGDREQRAASAESFYQDLLGPATSRTRATRKTSGTVRGQSARTLRHVSLASIGVAAACSLLLLLPTARKIVAEPEDGGLDAGPAATTLATHHVDGAAPIFTADADAADAADTTDSNPDSVITTTDDGTAAETAAPVTRASGLVTFEKPAMVASAAQSLIAIPLKREHSTRGTAAVEWQVQSGSARPNVDYKPMQPQIVRFNDGEAVRSIFIPLLRGGSRSGAHSARSFTVILRAIDGGARLGAVTRVNVTIEPQPLFSDLRNEVAAAGLRRH